LIIAPPGRSPGPAPGPDNHLNFWFAREDWPPKGREGPGGGAAGGGRGDTTSAGHGFSPTVELGRRVGCRGGPADVFRAGGFSEPTGAIRWGSFPNTPSEPCGGAGVSCRRAASDLPTFPPERSAGFSFPWETNQAQGCFSDATGFDVCRVFVFLVTRRIDPGTRTLCVRDVIVMVGQ
jgi:hypothetical protein